jgi:hypothetical protein
MKITALLAIVFTVALATAALAGPRGDPYWQPCNYGTNAVIDGSDCG